MTVCGIQHADGVCVMAKCPYIKKCCPVVWDKSKSEPQTNEEWFNSLSTKEKAKWLDGLIAYCFGVGHITEKEQKKYQHIVADVESWLKQPHQKE